MRLARVLMGIFFWNPNSDMLDRPSAGLLAKYSSFLVKSRFLFVRVF